MIKNLFFIALLFICFTLLPRATNAFPDLNKNELSFKSNTRNTATRVYFSNQVPVAGVAVEGTTFDIDPTVGSFLYLVIDNYPNNFTFDQVQIKVYKSVNGQSQKYDEKTYNISTSQYFTYIKYSFYTSGYYIFDVYSKYGTFLGTAKVTINYKGSSAEATAAPSASVDVYAKSKVYFSTDVPYYGIAKDVKTFILKSGGGFIYVIVDNYPNNFNVSYLKMTMYKMVDGYYVKQDQANYDINANNFFTYFKYNMYSAGDYKFVFYDALDRYVNTGYVTITW